MRCFYLGKSTIHHWTRSDRCLSNQPNSLKSPKKPLDNPPQHSHRDNALFWPWRINNPPLDTLRQVIVKPTDFTWITYKRQYTTREIMCCFDLGESTIHHWTRSNRCLLSQPKSSNHLKNQLTIHHNTPCTEIMRCCFDLGESTIKPTELTRITLKIHHNTHTEIMRYFDLGESTIHHWTHCLN